MNLEFNKDKPMPPLLRVDQNRVLRALCPCCHAPVRSIKVNENTWWYVDVCDKCGQMILDEQRHM